MNHPDVPDSGIPAEIIRDFIMPERRLEAQMAEENFRIILNHGRFGVRHRGKP